MIKTSSTCKYVFHEGRRGRRRRGIQTVGIKRGNKILRNLADVIQRRRGAFRKMTMQTLHLTFFVPRSCRSILPPPPTLHIRLNKKRTRRAFTRKQFLLLLNVNLQCPPTLQQRIDLRTTCILNSRSSDRSSLLSTCLMSTRSFFRVPKERPPTLLC